MDSIEKAGLKTELFKMGYREVEWYDCPISWDIGVSYFRNDNNFAMVNQNGQIIMWEHPRETEMVQAKINQYKGE